jgi:hypothetical protein
MPCTGLDATVQVKGGFNALAVQNFDNLPGLYRFEKIRLF